MKFDWENIDHKIKINMLETFILNVCAIITWYISYVFFIEYFLYNLIEFNIFPQIYILGFCQKYILGNLNLERPQKKLV